MFSEFKKNYKKLENLIETVDDIPSLLKIKNEFEKSIKLIDDMRKDCIQYEATPLHFFCGTKNNKKHIKDIEALLNIGADINKKAKHGKTPLFWAMHPHSSSEVVKYLLMRGAD